VSLTAEFGGLTGAAFTHQTATQIRIRAKSGLIR
jgi:hypothetical protein